MAQKRMFDRAIIDTDRFMDLGMTAKAFYFLLGMEADDEGFVSYKKVMRIHGGNEDDMKLLTAKGFILHFPSGVVVITDWHSNNYLDSRRLRPTEYQDEKKLLVLTGANKYEFSHGLASIEERSIEENTSEVKTSQKYEILIEEEKPKKEKKDIAYRSIFELWGPGYPLHWNKNITEIEAAKNLLKESSVEDVKWFLGVYEKYKAVPYCPTILKPSDVDRKWDNLLAFKKKHG